MKPIIKCNDNLREMNKLPDNSVDLIYIDPPFHSKKNWGDFKDTWGSIQFYLDFMKPRVEELHRVLKPGGTAYIHLDSNANAYMRVMADQIFGMDAFKNEIIWAYKGPSTVKQGFPRKHDTIYRYVKAGSNPTFNADAVRVPYDPDTIEKRKYEYDRHLKGKKMTGINATAKPRKPGTYLKGKIPEDWWADIGSGGQMSHKQYTGYATQKPEPLIERIINMTTSPGDTVLDSFAGSGTTCSVANKMGRQSICIDVNPKACKIMGID